MRWTLMTTLDPTVEAASMHDPAAEAQRARREAIPEHPGCSLRGDDIGLRRATEPDGLQADAHRGDRESDQSSNARRAHGPNVDTFGVREVLFSATLTAA